MTNHARIAIVATLTAALACNIAGQPQTKTADTQVPLTTLVPTLMPAHTPSLLAPRAEEQVSAARLLADVKALSAIHTRHVNSDGAAQAARHIHEQFEAAGGRLVVTDEPFSAEFNGITSGQANVVATLPGDDASAGSILVGAHYDSRTLDLRDSTGRAPGANDNASGVAVVLELARIISEERPRLTIKLVAFGAEEVGRQGSIQFVRAAKERGEIFRGMIALDIVGEPDGAEREWAVRVFSAGPDDSPSRALARALRDEVNHVLDVLVQDAADRPGRYSDHISFSEAGFPAVRLIQVNEDKHNHSADDTADHVNPDYIKKVTQLTLLAIEWLEVQP